MSQRMVVSAKDAAGVVVLVLCVGFFAGGMESVAAADPEAASEFEPAAWGAIQGRIVLDGDRPAPRELKVTRNRDLLDGEKLLDESVLVHPENRGVANVVVTLRPEQQGIRLPSPPDRTADEGKAELQMERLAFRPRVLAVQVGQELEFQNLDPVAHSVRFVPQGGNPLFSQLVTAEVTARYVFQSPEQKPLSVTSTIHPWMEAYLVVVDHPYVAVTDSNGRFTLPRAPAGVWEITLWHETVGIVQRCKVDDGDFSFIKGKLLVQTPPDGSAVGSIMLSTQQLQRP